MHTKRYLPAALLLAVALIGGGWLLFSGPSSSELSGNWVQIDGVCTGTVNHVRGMDIDLTNNKLVMDGSARVIRSVESSPITDFTIACESLGPLKFTSRYTLQMVGRDDVVMDFGYASGRPVLLEHNSATAKVWYRLDDAFTQKVRSMMTSTNTPQTH